LKSIVNWLPIQSMQDASAQDNRENRAAERPDC
jgi:hypothetical protein